MSVQEATNVIDSDLEIVAHRGVPEVAPENTLPAFRQAIELGADVVEFDVRLTRDKIPVVYHYFYLDVVTKLAAPIYEYTLEELREAGIFLGDEATGLVIPTLREVLEELGGKVGLEIEIKGPEPEAPGIVSARLHDFRDLWDTMELTSYEPAFLLEMQALCPGIPTDLLVASPQNWMGRDVYMYSALQRARVARARAVHLHPSYVSPEGLDAIRTEGIEVHAWDVNDERSLRTMTELGIQKLSTDQLRLILQLSGRD